MARDLEWTIERGLESYDVLVVYEVSSWGYPAQLYGPPENCWPGEGPEFEILHAEIEARPWAKPFYRLQEYTTIEAYRNARFALTDAEREAIYDHLCMNPPEPDEPDPDDWRDEQWERDRLEDRL